MPDWKSIVREHLRVLNACSSGAESISDELACHLEDNYEACLRAGLTEELALERVLEELRRSRENSLTLQLLKENAMTGFARKLGLPGLFAFTLAMVIAWALDRAHIQPKTIVLSNGLFLSLPVVWFCVLPVCGALGAALSRRNGGSRFDGFVAATFPATILGAVLLLIFIAGWIISLFTRIGASRCRGSLWAC
jgi:hypothetical protein